MKFLNLLFVLAFVFSMSSCGGEQPANTDAPKTEEPAKEEVKAEEPAKEEVKAEEPKTEEAPAEKK